MVSPGNSLILKGTHPSRVGPFNSPVTFLLGRESNLARKFLAIRKWPGVPNLRAFQLESDEVVIPYYRHRYR